MISNFKRYNHETDFNRIKDFYIDNYASVYPRIWSFERWNYMVYFIRDMFEFSIEKLEETIGIWEDENRDIVGIATHEAVGRGEAFIHIHSQYYEESLLEEILNFIEEKYAFESDGKLVIKLRILDGDKKLESLAENRGYFTKAKAAETTSSISLDQEFTLPVLPKGYRIQSMADDNNIDKRTLTFAKAFGNFGTEDEVQPQSYLSLQQCPDYRKDLDVYVVSPDEEFVAFCLIWFDQKNKIGMLEPVGTNPDHRKKGLAKAAVYEAMNRIRKEGAERVYVGDGQQFYLSIGFKHTHRHSIWFKETEL